MRVRGSFLGAVAALLLAAGATAAPAHAVASGQIDGTITDSSGAPVSTCVYVYDATYSYAGSACTDKSGAYTVDGLTDGTAYRVDVPSDGTHLEQWFGGGTSFDSATDVIAPGTADVTVALGGTLSGTLTDTTGAPAVGYQVAFYGTDQNVVTNTYTDETGHWSQLLPPGDFKVEFSDWPTDMWFSQAFSFDEADTLTVSAGATTTADAQMLTQGTIVGTVTSQSGTPLKNVQACASTVGTDPTSTGYAGCWTSDAAGHYRIPLTSPGTYLVQFFDQANRGYVGVFAGGTRDETKARQVVVARVGEVTVDQSMSKGAVVTGRAVNSLTGRGIPNVCGHATQSPPDSASSYIWGSGTICSGSDGVYTVNGLPTGTIILELSPDSQAGLPLQYWYPGSAAVSDATAIMVAAHRTTTLKPVRFLPGGTVSGTVRTAAGKPVPNTYVDLSGQYAGRPGGAAGPTVGYTDSHGRYTVNIQQGTYRPIAYKTSGDLAPVWSGGATTSADATPVVVRPQRTTTLDLTMVTGGRFRGTVVDAHGGTPPGYVFGSVYTASGDYVGDFDSYSDNGFALLSTPLPAGRLVLRGDIRDPDTFNIVSTFWYDGSPTRAGATVASLAKGQTKRVTFHLP